MSILSLGLTMLDLDGIVAMAGESRRYFSWLIMTRCIIVIASSVRVLMSRVHAICLELKDFGVRMTFNPLFINAEKLHRSFTMHVELPKTYRFCY